MLIIGKSKKYWTLWNVEGSSHTYMKNISYDLATAREKYPDASIDESLCGTKRFNNDVYSNKIVFENQKMPFGKYKNELIDNVPESYLIWFFNNTHDDYDSSINDWINNNIEKFKSIFAKNGYILLNLHDNRKIAVKETRIVESSIAKNIENNEEFEVVFDSNLSSNGIASSENAVFIFEDIKLMDYRGYEYALPTINGKAKRIKNKRIRIVKYEYEKMKNEHKPMFCSNGNIYLDGGYRVYVNEWKLV